MMIIEKSYVLCQTKVNNIKFDESDVKFMELNRQELWRYMDDVDVRNKTSEEQNRILIEKIESIFEYIKDKSCINVVFSQDTYFLTQRQVTTFLNSLSELDNDDILSSYFEFVDFVNDYGNMSRPILFSVERDVLQFHLQRIYNKIKKINNYKYNY